MMFPIYNLSTAYCPWNEYAERQPKLKVIDCLNENNEKVENVFIEKNSFYQINLIKEKNYWKFYVDLHLVFDFVPNSLRFFHRKRLLVKCYEHILINDSDNGYILNLDHDNEIKYKSSFKRRREAQGFYFVHFFMKVDFEPHIEPLPNKDDVADISIKLYEDYLKKKLTSFFRKTIGIAGGKIKTTLFKCRLFLKVRKNASGTTTRVVVETEPFSFFENEKGEIFLNERVKFERCNKSLNMDQ
ncbi:hypothetical protein CDIK_2081 [Cucumispora dikerogammari]|nr:hypothetical protein CDIK_2081 [Cucumispora dikerogammari]